MTARRRAAGGGGQLPLLSTVLVPVIIEMQGGREHETASLSLASLHHCCWWEWMNEWEVVGAVGRSVICLWSRKWMLTSAAMTVKERVKICIHISHTHAVWHNFASKSVTPQWYTYTPLPNTMKLLLHWGVHLWQKLLSLCDCSEHLDKASSGESKMQLRCWTITYNLRVIAFLLRLHPCSHSASIDWRFAWPCCRASWAMLKATRRPFILSCACRLTFSRPHTSEHTQSHTHQNAGTDAHSVAR